MATQVEANSLSDITYIAGNPPKYPRNPTEQKRQSLTLYIARVPGTRDIILTTLKPQLKNVTASDVENSLYYFHLNSEEDAKLLEEEQNVKSDAESTMTLQKPLPRKRLPDSGRSSLDINRQAAPPLVQLDSNTALTTKRKPVPSSDAVPKLSDPAPSKPLLSRRPLGPRPQLSNNPVDRKPLPGSPNYNFNDSRSTQSRNASPGRPSLDVDAGAAWKAEQHHNQSETANGQPAFTITIIRRDPSTASQWNVGTVTGTPVPDINDRARTTPQQSKRAFFNMAIHLMTPGYAPFRNSYLTSQMESVNLSPRLTNQFIGVDGSVSKQSKSNHGFDREVRMEGSDFWTRSFAQHKRTNSDVSATQGITRGRSFSGSAGIDPSEAPPNAVAHNSSNSAKGYMFLSPWNGHCKFSTSSSGRSLRCRHTLPDPVSASNGEDESGQSSVAVSEIRFNLPSAAIFNSVAESFSKKSHGDHRFSIPAFDQIRSKLSAHKSPQPKPPRPHTDSHVPRYPSDEEPAPPLPPRPNPTSFTTESSEDEPPRNASAAQHQSSIDQRYHEEYSQFDLSLGKEKAGGGNRGKRAKLGKLIIHDEGFKFLDLLVASNIAVWWSVWEPDF